MLHLVVKFGFHTEQCQKKLCSQRYTKLTEVHRAHRVTQSSQRYTELTEVHRAHRGTQSSHRYTELTEVHRAHRGMQSSQRYTELTELTEVHRYVVGGYQQWPALSHLYVPPGKPLAYPCSPHSTGPAVHTLQYTPNSTRPAVHAQQYAPSSTGPAVRTHGHDF